ncbi:MAG: hypothetical protein ACREPF_01835 [Rhodanobacteraceae bacterium]
MGARVAEGAARIRKCLGLRAWQDALEAARNRQADLEALCAGLDDATTPHVRALLEAALRDDRAIEPEVAHLRARAQQQLQQAGLRMRAASQYRVLAPPRPRD